MLIVGSSYANLLLPKQIVTGSVVHGNREPLVWVGCGGGACKRFLGSGRKPEALLSLCGKAFAFFKGKRKLKWPSVSTLYSQPVSHTTCLSALFTLLSNIRTPLYLNTLFSLLFNYFILSCYDFFNDRFC